MILGEARKMLVGWSFRQGDDAILPNTASWVVTNTSSVTYQIRVSWPLRWTSRDVQKQHVHAMYEVLAILLESASR